jgi:AcrR family transcriptional regulator
MSMASSQIRKYTLKARAERQAETRRRIVEATAALHADVGPARTTVAEIARRAGVQRLTVYNNFPDEKTLFAACGDHWLAQNPPPDPSSAAFAIENPAQRLHAVLRALYGWYRRTARASENLQRDRLVMPALDAAMRTRMDKRLSALANGLATGFSPPTHSAATLRVAIALALDFWTWRRLSREGLSDDAAADLMLASANAALDNGLDPVRALK